MYVESSHIPDNFTRFVIPLGNDPVNWDADRYRLSRFDSNPILDGNVPLSLVPARPMAAILLIRPMEDGILP
jgi:hypothetical protein